MPRCPSCREWLSPDPDRVGARCPHCRAALYERDAPRRRAAAADAGQCVTHPTSVAAGTCQRCGNFCCAVCRTRFQRKVLCLACVERALESRDASPEEARTHYLQALWSLICGVGGWAIGLIGVLCIAFGLQAGPENPRIVAVLPGLLFTCGAPLFVVPGLGLGAAAIRSRGDHLILATAGLVLSALMAGAIVGMVCLNVWRN